MVCDGSARFWCFFSFWVLFFRNVVDGQLRSRIFVVPETGSSTSDCV